MAPVLVTWNDLAAGLFKRNPSNICAIFYQISTATAELLVTVPTTATYLFTGY